MFDTIAALSDTAWTRISYLLSLLFTFMVAILVALLTTRRESGKQVTQRLFDFRDERAEMYADFTSKMNICFARYWDCVKPRSAMVDLQEIAEADAAALDLDSAAIRIQLHAPEYVAHSCLNVNGRLNAAIASLTSQPKIDLRELDYDVARNNAIKCMKIDLRLIEKSTSRSKYTKAALEEGKRYEKLTGFTLPE